MLLLVFRSKTWLTFKLTRSRYWTLLVIMSMMANEWKFVGLFMQLKVSTLCWSSLKFIWDLIERLQWKVFALILRVRSYIRLEVKSERSDPLRDERTVCFLIFLAPLLLFHTFFTFITEGYPLAIRAEYSAQHLECVCVHIHGLD